MKKAIEKLAVSEVFYSIQGEGQTMGIPAVFLRLGGCNLLCESKTWRCDTIEVWRKSKATLFQDVLSDEYVEILRSRNAHLVITGGEPMLHKDAICEYLQWFAYKYGFRPIVEIETNGTIQPNFYLQVNVDYWNVSPKLKSAGEQNPFEKRYNDDALSWFKNRGSRAIFKFVVAGEDDILEIFQDFAPSITHNQVVLMPAGSSREELEKTRSFVVEKCKQLKLRYSDRLHVVIWNLKTGV